MKMLGNEKEHPLKQCMSCAMTLAQKIFQRIEKLPELVQAEILDFVDFIQRKKEQAAGHEWTGFSLSSAMRGMEDEPLPEYRVYDLIEKFQ